MPINTNPTANDELAALNAQNNAHTALLALIEIAKSGEAIDDKVVRMMTDAFYTVVVELRLSVRHPRRAAVEKLQEAFDSLHIELLCR